MRMALLIGAKPKVGLESSYVQLRAGTWISNYETKDSVLKLVARNPVLAPNLDGEFILSEPTDVKVIMIEKGTENYINAYVECLSL